MTRAIHTMLLALALWPALACAQDAPTSASPHIPRPSLGLVFNCWRAAGLDLGGQS